MISKHRNRGIWQVALAVVLTVVFVVMVSNGKRNLLLNRIKQEWIVLGFVVYLAAVTLWMMGGFSFAKAKGYDSDMTGSIFLFLFLVGFCVPISPLVFPAFVLIGLKDRTRRRDHRRKSSRTPAAGVEA